MGFWIKDDEGNSIHVNGDDDMDEETENAIRELAKAALKQLKGDSGVVSKSASEGE